MTVSPDFIKEQQLATRTRRACQPIWNALDELGLLNSGFVLGCSGGTDSRAVFEALINHSDLEKRKIHVVCVDHGHRKDAFDEAEWVKEYATSHGFKADAIHLRAESSDEANLRRLRLSALDDYAASHSIPAIVLCQHADDMTESLMLGLLGLGTPLSPIPSERLLGHASVVRPFLRLPKSSLMDVLEILGVEDAFVDAEDQAGGNQRAMLRHSGLFERLDHMSSSWRERLLRLASSHSELTGKKLETSPSFPVSIRVSDAELRRNLQLAMRGLGPEFEREGRPAIEALVKSVASGKLSGRFAFRGGELVLERYKVSANQTNYEHSQTAKAGTGRLDYE